MWAKAAELDEYWKHWGFSPFCSQELEGVSRRVTFSKGALLGEVARYYSHDTILWKHSGEETACALLRDARPLEDVMTQRFVLLVETGEGRPRVRSFCFGFRGFVEVLLYRAEGKAYRKFRDLTDLIDAAPGFLARKRDAERMVVDGL